MAMSSPDTVPSSKEESARRIINAIFQGEDDDIELEVVRGLLAGLLGMPPEQIPCDHEDVTGFACLDPEGMVSSLCASVSKFRLDSYFAANTALFRTLARDAEIRGHFMSRIESVYYEIANLHDDGAMCLISQEDLRELQSDESKRLLANIETDDKGIISQEGFTSFLLEKMKEYEGEEGESWLDKTLEDLNDIINEARKKMEMKPSKANLFEMFEDEAVNVFLSLRQCDQSNGPSCNDKDALISKRLLVGIIGKDADDLVTLKNECFNLMEWNNWVKYHLDKQTDSVAMKWFDLLSTRVKAAFSKKTRMTREATTIFNKILELDDDEKNEIDIHQLRRITKGKFTPDTPVRNPNREGLKGVIVTTASKVVLTVGKNNKASYSDLFAVFEALETNITQDKWLETFQNLHRTSAWGDDMEGIFCIMHALATMMMETCRADLAEQTQWGRFESESASVFHMLSTLDGTGDDPSKIDMMELEAAIGTSELFEELHANQVEEIDLEDWNLYFRKALNERGSAGSIWLSGWFTRISENIIIKEKVASQQRAKAISDKTIDDHTEALIQKQTKERQKMWLELQDEVKNVFGILKQQSACGDEESINKEVFSTKPRSPILLTLYPMCRT